MVVNDQEKGTCAEPSCHGCIQRGNVRRLIVHLFPALRYGLPTRKARDIPSSYKKHSPPFKAKVVMEALKDEEAPAARRCLLTETTSLQKFLEVNTNV